MEMRTGKTLGYNMAVAPTPGAPWHAWCVWQRDSVKSLYRSLSRPFERNDDWKRAFDTTTQALFSS